MPFFVRTRRLDISRLETKPQESLEVVHAILIAAIKDVEEKCNRVERAFYGSGKNGMDEVSKWKNSVREVMTVACLPAFTTASQLDNIFKQALDPSKKFTVDTYDLNRTKECYRKIMESVPSKLDGIVHDLRKISNYLQKYCLSFYSLEKEGEIYLDTAHNYEVHRQGFMAIIHENISKAHKLPLKFKTTGLFASDLSSYASEIGRKGDCLFAPFLLIFPEAIDGIHNTCNAMTSWINADANYAVFLANDVTDLESRRVSLQQKARDEHQEYHKLIFRLNHMKKDCEQLVDELERLEDKENELTVEEETLLGDTNEMQLQIERKEYRRDDLLKNSSHMHPQVFYEKYSRLCEELRDLKLRLPSVKRQLVAAQYKLTWIHEKRDNLRIEEKKLRAVENELEQIDQSKQEHDIEVDNTDQLLTKAREIYLYKSSPDAVEKIFNERPIEVNKSRLPGNRGDDDPFEQACFTVASTVDVDWPRLYRALPFHPPRGQNTIDDDVREFSNMAARLGTHHITLRCLHRWRRFHTRAKLDDLTDALRDIRRLDILQAIDEKLNPPKPPTPKPEVIPDFLDEYLIPFWREGEKFDKLRAANKI